MSEPTDASPMRTWLWLLGILAIGLSALLIWHQKHTHQQILGHKAEIVAQKQALTAAQAEQASLKSQMSTQAEEHEARETSLRSDLDAAAKAQEDLKSRMQADQQAHEATIAQLRDQAKQVEADLQHRLQGATDHIAALKADIEHLHQAAAEAAASHEAHAQRITADLTAEVDKFRTLLEGSDPEKAALLADWEQRLQAAGTELTQTRQALDTERANLANLNQSLSSAQAFNAELQQGLAAAGQKLEATAAALAQEREALAALRDEHLDLQGKLQHTEMAHAGTQSQLDELARSAAAKEAELTQAVKTGQEQAAALATDLAALQAKAKSDLAALQAQSKADLAALEAKATARQEELRRQAADELAQVKASEEDARAHLKAIYQRLSTLGGRSTDNGILLSLAEREVRFGTAKADLPPGDIPSLDQIATVLVEYPELKVRIEGHTDNSGRDETNLALSQKRAEAVMEALVQRGVAGERLTALGIGEARPIASNESQAGRSQNRRVEIYVLEP